MVVDAPSNDFTGTASLACAVAGPSDATSPATCGVTTSVSITRSTEPTATVIVTGEWMTVDVLPAVAFLAIRCLPRAPRQTLGVLALQAGFALALIVAVLFSLSVQLRQFGCGFDARAMRCNKLLRSNADRSISTDFQTDQYEQYFILGRIFIPQNIAVAANLL